MFILGYSKRNFKKENSGEDVIYYRVSYLSDIPASNSDHHGFDANYFNLGVSKFMSLRDSLDYAIDTKSDVKFYYNRWGKIETIEI